MRHNVRVLCLSVVLTLLLGVMLSVQPVRRTGAQEVEDPISRIDRFLRDESEKNDFSGSVLIARDGEILLSEGYGLANREWNIPNTPDTKFRIGSITKQFTAMAVLMLQERGSLTVEDPICQYLEECPDAWQDITIHQLVTHTSGIPDFLEMPGYQDALPSLPSKTVELFINEPLVFAPGEAWSYSSSGYILLGLIISEVAGTPYKRFVNRNILEPLGMMDTGFEGPSAVLERRADGYINSRTRAAYIHMSIPDAAGGMYSTVEDLYRWDQALHGGQVVASETFDAMIAAAAPLCWDDAAQLVRSCDKCGTGTCDELEWTYAYGLFVGPVAEHPAIVHGGAINGFRSSAIRLTEENVTIIILSDFENVNPGLYSELITEMLFRGD